MQMTYEQAQRSGLLQAFASRNNGYMMRSEKRAGPYGSGRQPGRPPRRKRAGFFYIFLTLLISVILWPIGMVMLWRKKVRMQAGTKLLISLLTLCISVFLIVFALTVPVENEQFTAFQDRANDWLDQAAEDITVAGDAAYKKGTETWEVMSGFADAGYKYASGYVANGLNKGVEYAGEARDTVTKLLHIQPAEPVVTIIPVTEVPATEKPATEKPATEKPATEKPATEKPATEKPATEKPATEKPATEKPATEKPATEKPATEKPATENPATEKSATEKPATEKPATEKPATEKPATEKPATEKPATEKPATEKPATEAPAAMAPATEKPATKEPATEKPATEKPAKEKPATEKPATEKPATEKPATEKPATEKPATKVPATEVPVTEAPATKAATAEPAKTEAVDIHLPETTPEPESATALTDGTLHADGTFTPESEKGTEAEATPKATPAATKVPATAEPTAKPTPTPVPKPTYTVKPASEATVFFFPGGKGYHIDPNVHDMGGAPAHTLAEGIASGKNPCQSCGVPGAEVLDIDHIAWVDEANRIHTTDECKFFKGKWRLMSLEAAVKSGCEPCPECHADQYREDVVPTPAPTAEPTPTPKPTPEPTPVVVSPSTPLKSVGDMTVYYYDASRAYHVGPDCKGMSGAPAHTISQALAAGKRACGNCNPPSADLIGLPVLWLDENGLCHTTNSCPAFSGNPRFIQRDEALAKGMTGCTGCGADEYLVPGTVLSGD